MKKLRKMLSVVLAVMVAATMGMAMTASSFALTKDTTISITGMKAGDTASYYKIVKEDQNAQGGWALTQAFGNLTIGDLTDGEITDADLQKIISNLPAVTGTLDTDGTTLKKDNVDPGLYLVVATPAAGNQVVYNPMVVSVDYYQTNTTNTAAAKKQDIEVKKEVNGSDDTRYDVTVGDTVGFTITPTIPVFPKNYTAPVCKVSDTLGTGLELDGDVTVNGVPEGKYTVSNKTATGFTVTFDSDWLKTLTASPEVTITYNAEVTSAATYNVNEMDNTAKLKYSNSPTDTNGNGETEDKTYNYTFSIDAGLLGSSDTATKTKEVAKIGVDKNGNNIEGTVAEYTTKNGTEPKVPLGGAVFKLEGGKYTGSNAKTAQSNADGSISFTGLDAGTYTLTETSAPAGYVADTNPHTVVIAATYKDDADGNKVLDYYTVTIDGNQSKYTLTNQGETTITATKTTEVTSLIQNTVGKELPSTGGMGTTLFYIIGALLIVGCGVILIARRRTAAK